VWDNINSRGEIARHMVFTYNVGTFLGAAHELYNITGDSQYLRDATLAANYVIDNMTVNQGTLSDAPGGDGGLFHGIFFRYFVKLINEKDLDIATRTRFRDYITRLASVMADEGINPRTKLYAGRWHQAPADNDVVSLTSHLTGCMLIEAMCTIKPIK
ncbi:MAG: glycoside hydrolase family 76 protein, partial [bacterium]|nr:glycoside hydrolase family 76 protein [bacterium]